MKDYITVLVTGVGGPLGISVLKALAMSNLPVRLIGTDIESRSIGLYLVDKAFLTPHSTADPQGYISRLCDIVQKEKVKAIFPCSESELLLISKHLDDFANINCVVSANPHHLLTHVMDKHLLACNLRANGLPSPDSTVPDEDDYEEFIERHGFPLLLKSRFDSGSRNLYKINNRQQLDFFCDYVSNPVIQEILVPDCEEYTVGVFKAPDKKGEGTIILRRQLAAGLTYKAELITNHEISNICLKVINHFGLFGIHNIQLILTNNGPKIFEINPRCSSSTVIRAFFGFNEPELFLRTMILCEKVTPNHVPFGIALRMWDEIYLDPSTVQAFTQSRMGEHMHFMYGLSPNAIHREDFNYA